MTKHVTVPVAKCPSGCTDAEWFVQNGKDFDCPTLYAVECSCKWVGPVFDTPEKAIEAWNARSAAPQEPGGGKSREMIAYDKGFNDGRASLSQPRTAEIDEIIALLEEGKENQVPVPFDIIISRLKAARAQMGKR